MTLFYLVVAVYMGECVLCERPLKVTLYGVDRHSLGPTVRTKCTAENDNITNHQIKTEGFLAQTDMLSLDFSHCEMLTHVTFNDIMCFVLKARDFDFSCHKP